MRMQIPIPESGWRIDVLVPAVLLIFWLFLCLFSHVLVPTVLMVFCWGSSTNPLRPKRCCWWLWWWWGTHWWQQNPFCHGVPETGHEQIFLRAEHPCSLNRVSCQCKWTTFFRTENPDTYDGLFQWANRLLLRFETLGRCFCVRQHLILNFLSVVGCILMKLFSPSLQSPRRLFGATEIEGKLQKSKIVLDSLFTGVDCPHAAYQYLSAACRRRRLAPGTLSKRFCG